MCQNHQHEKMRKNPKVKNFRNAKVKSQGQILRSRISGMPRSNPKVKSQGQILRSNPKVKNFRNAKVKSQGQMPRSNAKVKNFRNVWNVWNVKTKKEIQNSQKLSSTNF